MNDKSLCLYGASGHAKVLIEIAEVLNYKILGLVDKNPAVKSLLGYPIDNKFTNSIKKNKWIISIGNNQIRKNISHFLDGDFITLIHPSVNLSSRATIGKGTVLMAGVTVNANVSVGDHCILNTNSSIDHDCLIENYVHISPNVAIAGNVTIGEGTHVGIGACVIQGIKIGKWCTIGAGAVIIRDIPDNYVVVGNPAKPINNSLNTDL